MNDGDEGNDWVFLFGPAHRHPETGEPLVGRYVRIREPLGPASQRMAVMFPRFGWSHSVPASELAAIEREYGTRELPEFRWPGFTGAQPEAVMKTAEQVIEAIRASKASPREGGMIYMPWGFPCIDGRDCIRLASWLPRSEWKLIGIEAKDETIAHAPNPWTRDAFVGQLQRDVAFGFEKALSRRGISSELMHTVVRMWLWVLGDPLHDTEDYPMYGLPLFKRVAVKYGFDNPIGEATGREDRYGSEQDR